MTQVIYQKNSFYNQTPQTTKYLQYLDFWNGYYILPQSSDMLMTIEDTMTHRPDMLSYQVYGSSLLWWVFMLRNPDVLQDPIWDFIPGKQIYVPAKDTLVRFT